MTFPFLNLPVELQRQCIDCLDTETVKSMRQVAKNVSSLATSRLFRELRLMGDDQSAERFESVLANEEFGRHARKVIIQPSENPWARPEYDGSRIDDELQFDDEGLRSWLEAINKIGQLPNLQELELLLAVDCERPQRNSSSCKTLSETEPFRTSLLELVFRILNDDLPKISTLTITNFQDATDTTFYNLPAVKSVQSRINSLHLRITTEHDDAAPENSTDIIGRHQLFKHDLQTYWLEPMKTHLTHLSLFCEDYWGIYPYCDLRNLHIPNLKSLALGNWSIAWDWQIEWITSHGATLETLILDDCPIVHAARMDIHSHDNKWPKPRRGTGRGRNKAEDRFMFPTLRWGEIFPIFQSKLTKLRKFGMGTQKGLMSDMSFELRYDLRPRLDASRYCIFDNGSGPSAWITFDDGYMDDCDPKDFHGRGYRGIEKSWEMRGLGQYVEFLKYPDLEGEEQGALDEFVRSLGRRDHGGVEERAEE